MALTEVKDPKGKKLLLVAGDEIKSADGRKTLLVVDGDFVRTEAGGKALIYFNGDMIRTKPNGELMLYVDGRRILREPGGQELLYVDGKEIRPTVNGTLMLRFDGDEVDSKQRMAVFYHLMPELFKVAAVDDNAMLASRAKVIAANDTDVLAGHFAINNFKSSDGTKRSGEVTIMLTGDVYVMELNFATGTPLQGVAIKQNGELWAAIGPVGTVGLGVYRIDGRKSSGVWLNATGKSDSFGSEALIGPDSIDGVYEIHRAKAPFSGAAYTGTVQIEAVSGPKLKTPDPIYQLSWNIAGYKINGVGLLIGKDQLIVATASTGADYSIVRFKPDAKKGTLDGNFFDAAKAHGTWTLKKPSE